MNIESYININNSELGENRINEIRKRQAASDFEEIFARHLVNELTKDSFKMTDNSSLGQSNSLYREFITDALASELAAQRRLGIAELVETYWNRVEAKNR